MNVLTNRHLVSPIRKGDLVLIKGQHIDTYTSSKSYVTGKIGIATEFVEKGERCKGERTNCDKISKKYCVGVKLDNSIMWSCYYEMEKIKK